MCGIMGYISFGKILPEKDKLTKMFKLLETRGHHASGFAFIGEDNLIVHKEPIKSSDMIKTNTWAELQLPKIMIFHARLKTQGDQNNNMNNHPIFNKSGMAIVHNGIISNDKQIFANNKRDAEVDSEAILAVLSNKSRGDKIKKVFDRLEGSYAFAVIDKHTPNTLILVKKDNPLSIYFNSEEDILYFCSEKQIMKESLGIGSVSKRGFNIGEGDYHFYEMENNHCLVLNQNGVASYKKYYPRKSEYHYSKTFNDEMIIDCPYCLSRTYYNPDKLINRCHYCGMEINEEELYVYA
jgi:glucosamine 6-phosphate synthetase-like amidotransferase/phosphosugar isomerase protein